MQNPGEDRNFPRYRRGLPVPLSELRRVDELAHSLERGTVTGEAGLISQTGATGPTFALNSTPGLLGFAAIITGQDIFRPWMYSFIPLLETPDTLLSNVTPIWGRDVNFFKYPDKTYNAMEGNLREDVPWDREPFLQLSGAATATGVNVGLSVGNSTMGVLGFVGTTTAGSSVVTFLSSVWGLQAGLPITGPGIPAGATISSVSILGAVVWMVPNAVPDFFTFYLYERVMIIKITGALITDSTQPGFGYYPAIEQIWNTFNRTWIDGDVIYFRDANM